MWKQCIWTHYGRFQAHRPLNTSLARWQKNDVRCRRRVCFGVCMVSVVWVPIFSKRFLRIILLKLITQRNVLQNNSVYIYWTVNTLKRICLWQQPFLYQRVCLVSSGRCQTPNVTLSVLWKVTVCTIYEKCDNSGSAGVIRFYPNTTRKIRMRFF